MKKSIILFLCVVSVVAISILISSLCIPQTQYLRIHIRANSNYEVDQNVKYCVKQAVVKEMSTRLDGVDSFDKAYNILQQNLSQMQIVADKTLKENGFDYTSKIRLCKEEFPTRSYEKLTLKSGVYDALIIELGTGEGDNWWCVVFPPLCFITAEESEDIEYVSLFAQWYEKIEEFWRSL